MSAVFRDAETECRPLAKLGLDPHGPSVGLNNAFGNSKPQAAAFCSLGYGIGAPEKFIENLALVFLFDPRPFVNNADND